MIMVWYISNFNNLKIKQNQLNLKNQIVSIYIYYLTHIIIVKLFFYKISKNCFLTNKLVYSKKIFNFLYYTKVVNIKYIGKIFKIKKFKKLLILTFNYPIFKYLIWNNIKLKWKKKPKRVFFFFLQTYTNLFQMFFFNLIYLRPLNTYTTRGIYNNLFLYHKRKKKVTNKR